LSAGLLAGTCFIKKKNNDIIKRKLKIRIWRAVIMNKEKKEEEFLETIDELLWWLIVEHRDKIDKSKKENTLEYFNLQYTPIENALKVLSKYNYSKSLNVSLLMEAENMKSVMKSVEDKNCIKGELGSCYKCGVCFSDNDKLIYKLGSCRSKYQEVGFKCNNCGHIELDNELSNE